MKKLNLFPFIAAFCLFFAAATFSSCDDNEPLEPIIEVPEIPKKPQEPEEPKIPPTVVEQGTFSTTTTENSVSKTQKIAVTSTDAEGNEEKNEYTLNTNTSWEVSEETIRLTENSAKNSDEEKIILPIGEVIKSVEIKSVSPVKSTIVTTFTIENTGFVLVHEKDSLVLVIDDKTQTFIGDDANLSEVNIDASKMTVEKTPSQVDGEDYYRANQPVSVGINIGTETTQKTFNQSYNL